jgi:peptide/nickel transport system substrate-binding protein
MQRLFMALIAGAIFIAGGTTLANTPKNTLVMAMNADDIISFDPAQVFELVGGEMIANIYDRVTMHEAEDLTALVGGVAESWEVSNNGHTITLKIRPNQKFHSGNPVTAADVVFSLTRVVKLEQTPVFLLNQFGWKPDNVDRLVTATGKMAVKLEIPENLAPTLVLNVLSAGVGSVVDMKTAMAHEKNGDLGHEWLNTHTAGSGPYELVSWKPNEGIIMKANPNDRHGAPNMKRIVVRHVPEAATQRLLIEKGDVDIARDLTPDQAAGLLGNSDVRIQVDPKGLLKYLQVNMKDPDLSKPKVREALRYLVDYDGMVNSFLKGGYKVHQAFWPSGFFASLTDKPFSLNIAKAKALLAEAGYANGLDVELDVFNSSPHPEMAQSVQATMAKAGIRIRILQAEKKAVYTKHRARQHQMILTHWSPDYLDPHSNADAFASNPDNRDEAKLTGVIAWRGAWEAAATTSVTADAKTELDLGKREGMYLALQRSVQMDSPFIFLFQNVAQTAIRANVSNFVSGPTFDTVFFRNVSKK